MDELIPDKKCNLQAVKKAAHRTRERRALVETKGLWVYPWTLAITNNTYTEDAMNVYDLSTAAVGRHDPRGHRESGEGARQPDWALRLSRVCLRGRQLHRTAALGVAQWRRRTASRCLRRDSADNAVERRGGDAPAPRRRCRPRAEWLLAPQSRRHGSHTAVHDAPRGERTLMGRPSPARAVRVEVIGRPSGACHFGRLERHHSGLNRDPASERAVIQDG